MCSFLGPRNLALYLIFKFKKTAKAVKNFKEDTTMSELKQTLLNFYSKEEVFNIINDIKNLPDGEREKEIENTINFFKKYGGEIPSII